MAGYLAPRLKVREDTLGRWRLARQKKTKIMFYIYIYSHILMVSTWNFPLNIWNSFIRDMSNWESKQPWFWPTWSKVHNRNRFPPFIFSISARKGIKMTPETLCSAISPSKYTCILCSVALALAVVLLLRWCSWSQPPSYRGHLDLRSTRDTSQRSKISSAPTPFRV